MKTLADNKDVSSKSYYYILDFIDSDRRILERMFNKNSLSKLTYPEYIILFEHCTGFELNEMKNIK